MGIGGVTCVHLRNDHRNTSRSHSFTPDSGSGESDIGGLHIEPSRHTKLKQTNSRKSAGTRFGEYLLELRPRSLERQWLVGLWLTSLTWMPGRGVDPSGRKTMAVGSMSPRSPIPIRPDALLMGGFVADANESGQKWLMPPVCLGPIHSSFQYDQDLSRSKVRSPTPSSSQATTRMDVRD